MVYILLQSYKYTVTHGRQMLYKFKQHFVISTPLYWEPVKIIKHRCSVLTSTEPIQNNVKIVQPWNHKVWTNILHSSSEKMSNYSNVSLQCSRVIDNVLSSDTPRFLIPTLVPPTRILCKRMNVMLRFELSELCLSIIQSKHIAIIDIMLINY